MSAPTNSRPASATTVPIERPPDGTTLPTDQSTHDNHIHLVGGHLLGAVVHGALFLPTDQNGDEIHTSCIGGHLFDLGHGAFDTQARRAEVDSSPIATNRRAQPILLASGWEELRICASLFDRAQAERIATCNLLGLKADGAPQSTGARVDTTVYGQHLELLMQTEHAARLMLRRCYRRVVPAELRDWQKAHTGIGEDSLARILGHLGDPYVAIPHWWEGTGTTRTLMQGEPYVRTIGQLWQYCGHGAPGRRVKGITADELAAQGSPTLKMLVHLQAEFCMKQKGHYRTMYETVRAAVAEKVHTVACVRCGPSGKPAQPDTPWSAGHQHAHALRIVGKEILRDMWLVRHHAETRGE